MKESYIIREADFKMNDSARPLFLALPYRVEFLNLVTGFVTECGQIFGANEKELFALRLAAEEVFSYIMEAFPLSDTEAVFHLKCTAKDGKVTFGFSNHGEPLNARATPEFAIDDLESTIAGLGLNLVRKLTDDCRFVNCGADGWVIFFVKQLAGFRPLPDTLAVEDVASALPADSKLRVFQATPEQVPQMISLVYRTYRYSYAKNYFYDDQSLRQALLEERVVAVVAEDAAGNIVGCTAIFFDSPQVAEIGGVMIDPRYRAGAGMLLLVKESKRLLAKDSFQDTVFYARTVTTHTQSQKLLAAMKFFPLGLRLSVYDHAKFIGIDEQQGHRESLIFAVLVSKLNGKTVKINAPAVHQEMIREIMLNSRIEAAICCDTAEPAAPAVTQLQIIHNEKAQFAEVNVEQLGYDFADILKQETFALQQDGYLTCLINIPADCALPVALEKVLQDNKYFFSGLQLDKQGGWKLMYTNLFHQRFQFANVRLYDPQALKLRDYIEQQYLRL